MADGSIRGVRKEITIFSVLIREQEDANLGFAGETVEEMKARIAAGTVD